MVAQSHEKGCAMVEEPTANSARRWTREQIAEQLARYQAEYRRLPSQRQLAEELDIPRSTLQYWLERGARLDEDPALKAFFESPVGVACLHRLVVAAHVVITLLGAGGIRLVCQFLEMTGLAPFVASSYSAQREVAMDVEKAVVAFGQAERQRLGASMAVKPITVGEDETFHPTPCLVAMEPASGFILLEKYTEDRQADTWTHCLAEATQGLRIEIIQSTSDEGRSLCHHVEQDLGGHHSPDLFHVQQDLVQGCSVVLASRQRQAAKALAAALAKGTLSPEDNGTAPPLPSPAYQTVQTIADQQDRVKRAVQGITTAYHPFDLTTGQAQRADQLADALAHHVADLEAVATEAHLPERCLAKIRKAQRVVVKMVATLTFFWTMVQAKVDALALPPAVEHAVSTQLIPGIYLDLVADKVTDPQQRAALRQQSQVLLAPLHQPTGPLASLNDQELDTLEAVALECAHLFQRSSSCVEGRNGQLALHHHALHRLSDRKLTALTTIHNFFIRRQDGTTAAQRFFGSPPKDLFEWLLERVTLPGWSALKRAHPQPKEYLSQAAA
jgi:hypothetical protein